MENKNTFTYIYSASQNREVQEIRKKYLPEENKMEELKRLDRAVQSSGVMSALIVGLIGFLLFGLAVCMIAKVISGGLVFGILLVIPSVLGMLTAYPIYRTVSDKTRARLVPRILELADELSK